MTPPRISLNQQIEGVRLAIERHRPFAHKTSDMTYQMHRLEAAVRTLEAVHAREDEVRAVLAGKKGDGG
jgi:hypothetical protein